MPASSSIRPRGVPGPRMEEGLDSQAAADAGERADGRAPNRRAGVHRRRSGRDQRAAARPITAAGSYIAAAQGLRRSLTSPLLAIALNDVSKVFGSGKKQFTAVDRLSLQVPQGQVFGLLGPNGSGKTTTISMTSGLIPASSGSIEILGMDVYRDRSRVRRLMGTVPQETALYEELTAWANMSFHADLYGVPRREKKERIAQLLDLVKLADRKDSRVGTFSGGMKRRLAIARALLHDPQLIILDEPTLGVDVQARAAIWAYIRDLRGHGKTILITTNVLEEAQELCDQVAIIDHGALVIVDTPSRLRQSHGGTVVSVKVQVLPDYSLSHALESLREVDGIRDVALAEPPAGAPGISEHELAIATERDDTLAGIVTVLTRSCEIRDLSVRESRLDEVFLDLTGSALRD
jgi:ABC-2 type transport system ATP-binding protein